MSEHRGSGTDAGPVQLCFLGLAVYGLVFALVFLERDGIWSYETVYGLFVLAGVVCTLLVVKGWAGPVVGVSVAAMVVAIYPLMFLFWVLLPQGLILAGAVWQMRRARLCLADADAPTTA